MIPPKVLNAVDEQLLPIVLELSKYNSSENETVKIDFGIGEVTFKFR